MLKNARFWFILVVGVIGAILAVDWMIGTARVARVQMEISAFPDTVLADGKNQTILTIQVTENGQPRSNDLIQLWLDKGSGLVIPNWVFTDENGVAKVTFTPNPYSPYDPVDGAIISVMNTSIGRLVEVDKTQQVIVNLKSPEE